MLIPGRIFREIPLGGLFLALPHWGGEHCRTSWNSKLGLPVINYHALAPGEHEARLQKTCDTIRLCWQLHADKEARFMCLPFL